MHDDKCDCELRQKFCCFRFERIGKYVIVSEKWINNIINKV